MKPHCPNCLKEMTKASASRNLFNCEPCREIIQYFGGGADHGEPGPQFCWPIRRKRSVHTATRPEPPGPRARRYPTSSPASAAIRGGRTTVTVQAASEATLAETLPSSVRRNELCRAPMMTWST